MRTFVQKAQASEKNPAARTAPSVRKPVHAEEAQEGEFAERHEGSNSKGAPLDAEVRARYESVLGWSLADIRIHNDARASASAEALNADAYTAGRDIVFNAGNYQPHSASGQRLLAHELAHTVQREFSDPKFRVYRHDDVVGVELGGSLKNVIAIAAGVVDGLELGHNTAAALITRGLAEMTRLVVACGGQAETMAGLAGLGDLVLTCTGSLSRNRSVGVELGKGRKLSDIISSMHGMVAEGVLTTDAAVGLALKYQLEMPITEQTHALLHEGKSPREAIHELMTRPFTTEVKLY